MTTKKISVPTGFPQVIQDPDEKDKIDIFEGSELRYSIKQTSKVPIKYRVTFPNKTVRLYNTGMEPYEAVWLLDEDKGEANIIEIKDIRSLKFSKPLGLAGLAVAPFNPYLAATGALIATAGVVQDELLARKESLEAKFIHYKNWVKQTEFTYQTRGEASPLIYRPIVLCSAKEGKEGPCNPLVEYNPKNPVKLTRFDFNEPVQIVFLDSVVPYLKQFVGIIEGKEFDLPYAIYDRVANAYISIGPAYGKVTLWSRYPDRFYLSYQTDRTGTLVGRFIRTPFIPFFEHPQANEYEESDSLGNVFYVTYYDPRGSGQITTKEEFEAHQYVMDTELRQIIPNTLAEIVKEYRP